ncbi:histone deacetylase complex subunit SAP25 [Tenrec ecaudatus]|uniref:histone deacetylase complex subunit SAP25 n=1 Tax=Tenrec ecaudatus TaxID=94439 RepID=UPI003F598B11
MARPSCHPSHGGPLWRCSPGPKAPPAGRKVCAYVCASERAQAGHGRRKWACAAQRAPIRAAQRSAAPPPGGAPAAGVEAGPAHVARKREGAARVFTRLPRRRAALGPARAGGLGAARRAPWTPGEVLSCARLSMWPKGPPRWESSEEDAPEEGRPRRDPSGWDSPRRAVLEEEWPHRRPQGCPHRSPESSGWDEETWVTPERELTPSATEESDEEPLMWRLARQRARPASERSVRSVRHPIGGLQCLGAGGVADGVNSYPRTRQPSAQPLSSTTYPALEGDGNGEGGGAPTISTRLPPTPRPARQICVCCQSAPTTVPSTAPSRPQSQAAAAAQPPGTSAPDPLARSTSTSPEVPPKRRTLEPWHPKYKVKVRFQRSGGGGFSTPASSRTMSHPSFLALYEAAARRTLGSSAPAGAPTTELQRGELREAGTTLSSSAYPTAPLPRPTQLGARGLETHQPGPQGETVYPTSESPLGFPALSPQEIFLSDSFLPQTEAGTSLGTRAPLGPTELSAPGSETHQHPSSGPLSRFPILPSLLSGTNRIHMHLARPIYQIMAPLRLVTPPPIMTSWVTPSPSPGCSSAWLSGSEVTAVTGLMHMGQQRPGPSASSNEPPSSSSPDESEDSETTCGPSCQHTLNPLHPQSPDPCSPPLSSTPEPCSSPYSRTPGPHSPLISSSPELYSPTRPRTPNPHLP